MCYVLDVIYAKSLHSLYARSTFHERFTKRAWPDLTVTRTECTSGVWDFSLLRSWKNHAPKRSAYDRRFSRAGLAYKIELSMLQHPCADVSGRKHKQTVSINRLPFFTRGLPTCCVSRSCRHLFWRGRRGDPGATKTDEVQEQKKHRIWAKRERALNSIWNMT